MNFDGLAEAAFAALYCEARDIADAQNLESWYALLRLAGIELEEEEKE